MVIIGAEYKNANIATRIRVKRDINLANKIVLRQLNEYLDL